MSILAIFSVVLNCQIFCLRQCVIITSDLLAGIILGAKYQASVRRGNIFKTCMQILPMILYKHSKPFICRQMPHAIVISHKWSILLGCDGLTGWLLEGRRAVWRGTGGGRACLCFGSKGKLREERKEETWRDCWNYFLGSPTPPHHSVPGSVCKYYSGGIQSSKHRLARR